MLRSIGPELPLGGIIQRPRHVGTTAAVGGPDPCQRSWVAPLVVPLLGVVMTIRTLRQLSGWADTLL